MPKIEDTGKVWIPGSFSPEYAVRVDQKVFVPGKSEEDTIACWVAGNHLCVDLHDPGREKRAARRFSLDLSPATAAALFNGFEKTRHGDVPVVTHGDAGVEEYSVEGKIYRRDSIGSMTSAQFWEEAEPRLRVL
ncbi:MAG: hypothetical protein ACE5E9_04595 [Nitrospinaceae bacterium]